MRLDVHFHIDPGFEVLDRLDDINRKLDLVLVKEDIIMGIAQDLEDEVAAETTVIGSVETVVQNLIDAVKAAGTDGPKLAAVLAAAQANKTRLGALAAANTPANPEAVASPAAPEII